ncbi:MAG: DUF5660 family protein, partial [Microgenomates group bacterium]
ARVHLTPSRPYCNILVADSKMDKNQKQKQQRKIKHTSVLESLKDVGGSTVKSLKKDLIQETPQEFLNQLFGKRPEKKYSGDLIPGESLEIKEVFSGKHEEVLKLKKQLSLEKRLREEEKIRVEKRGNELKIQLQTITEEIAVLAENTQNLAEEVQVATMQAPIEPGVYHLIFFEKLLDFIKSFRKKVEEAKVWLHASNKRAQKKNYWARYKKYGSKFLLAPDHYLSRSAG